MSLQREPFTLPLNIITDKRRLRLIEQYEAELSKCKNQPARMEVLYRMYEQVYSNGLKAMDNMHKTIDAMISQSSIINGH